MGNDLLVEADGPAVAELMADVAAAVTRRTAAVSGDVYEVILREIPQLRDDKPLLAAYTDERENWLRNRNAARAARIRRLLAGERVDVAAAEAVLGYRLRQWHALQASHWLGSSVLQPATAARGG